MRLEPALEKIITSFKSSMKPTRLGSVDKSRAIVDEFGMLQRFRVQKVLLVCSDYDSYTFEEEGCAGSPRRPPTSSFHDLHDTPTRVCARRAAAC